MMLSFYEGAMSKEKKQNFDLHEVQEAVICSDLSYYPPYTKEYNDTLAKLKKHRGDDSITGITPFYKTNPKSNEMTLAGYVIASENKLTVAYHGTSSISELINDVRVLHSEMDLQDDTKITGQAGFIDEFLASNQNRLQAIEMASSGRKYKNITYTGHSLGGAMASYAAMYDQSEPTHDPQIERKVATFGAPGSLSAQGAERYTELGLTANTLHTQLQYDPVTTYQTINAQLLGRKLVIPVGLNWSLHAVKDGYDKLFESETANLVKTELLKPIIETIEKYASYFDITSYSNTLNKVIVAPIYNALFNSNDSTSSLLKASETNTKLPLTPSSSPQTSRKLPPGVFIV